MWHYSAFICTENQIIIIILVGNRLLKESSREGCSTKQS